MSYWQTVHKNLNKDFESEIYDEDNENNVNKPTRFSEEHKETHKEIHNEIQKKTYKEDTIETFKDVEEKEKVSPQGNFLIKESSKKRKLFSLFGFDDSIPEKKEIIEKEQNEKDRPETEIEQWENQRNVSKEFSERDRRVALKRDELPEYDEDGYRYSPEQPTFRDGFNNTLRLKPLQNPDLHNGKILNIKGKEQFSIEKQMKVKPLKRLAPKKNEIFDTTKIKPSQTTQLKVKDTEKKFVRQNTNNLIFDMTPKLAEQRVQMYIPPNKRCLRKNLLKRDSINHTLGKYFMKALCETDVGIVPEQRKSILHSFLKQGDVLLEELGKAVIELGFVLPPEIHEKSKRHEYDAKAMDVGQKIFLQLYSKGEAPIQEQSLKNDLTLALGRTFENLKSLSNTQTNRILTPEIEKTRKKNQIDLSNITLQILENANTRIHQKGRVPEFRKEQELKEELKAEILLEVESPNRNGKKSIWDGFYKDDYINDRSLLPHRRDDL